MDVLIIGASSIARRRVFGALVGLTKVNAIHLASRREPPEEFILSGKNGRVFLGYDVALRELEPCLAYISLPNALHAEWAERALRAGFHVVVDKPAFLSLTDADRLARLAIDTDRCLAEATVWNYHSRIASLIEFIDSHGQNISRIAAVFSVPPFPPENFRWRAELGGGSIWDLGPYAASCSRVFLRDEPQEVVCRVHHRAETGVDVSFSVLTRCHGGRALIGHFGFDTAYQNSVSILSGEISADLDRVFTTPAGFRKDVVLRKNGEEVVLSAAPEDNFGVFFEAVINAIEESEWSRFRLALLQDARYVDALRRSAGVSS